MTNQQGAPEAHYNEMAAELRRIAHKPGSVAVANTLLKAAEALAMAAALVEAQQPAPSAAAATEVENLRKALQFYADKDHFTIADDGAWDTVSGEPQNYWCDEEGTATVEDGTIARLALAGHQIKFDADEAPQPSPTPQAEPLHITHGPLMRHAAALLRSRKPVLPDHESVAAELEMAADGHPTPAGDPSPEWLEVSRIAMKQAPVLREECQHCNGTGEVFGHAENCADDLCALNGDEHSCTGQVEPCQCAAPTPQADSAPAAAPADTVVLEAALRAIHQAIKLIGEPDTERLRTVRRVLRGAVVVAEDSNTPQADSVTAPAGGVAPVAIKMVGYGGCTGINDYLMSDGSIKTMRPHEVIWRDAAHQAAPIEPMANDIHGALTAAAIYLTNAQRQYGKEMHRQAIASLEKAQRAIAQAADFAKAAPGVLEDAARYRHLREADPDTGPAVAVVVFNDWGNVHRNYPTGDELDAVIDAARKQGASHE